MASDPLGALTLLGLGLELFSCNAMLVPEIRSLLRQASASQARMIVEAALEKSSGTEIRARLLEGFSPIIERVLGAGALSDDLEGEGSQS
jgi:signal transduction protein with GAF and PtsI domain